MRGIADRSLVEALSAATSTCPTRRASAGRAQMFYVSARRWPNSELLASTILASMRAPSGITWSTPSVPCGGRPLGVLTPPAGVVLAGRGRSA